MLQQPHPAAAVSPTLKRRQLEKRGKSEEDVVTYFRDVFKFQLAEDVEKFVDPLISKEWSNLLALVCGDRALLYNWQGAWNNFHQRCHGWSPSTAHTDDVRVVLFDSFMDRPFMRVLRVQQASSSQSVNKMCAYHAVIVVMHMRNVFRPPTPLCQSSCLT